MARSAGWLRVIAVFKLVKAALFTAVALGALQMVRPAIAARAQQAIETVATRIDRRWAQHLIAGMSRLGRNHFHVIAIGAFLYAALFVIEGVGLWMAKRWAEYLTVIATTSFVPIEVYELVRRATWPRVAALVINVAVVVYLVHRLRQPEDRGEAPA